MDTTEKSISRIAEYIKNQLEEDKMGEQLTMSERARLRAASNSLTQLADRICAFDVHVKNRGLCSHMIYHDYVVRI